MLEDAKVTISLFDLDRMRNICKKKADLESKIKDCGKIVVEYSDFKLVIDKEKAMQVMVDAIKEVHEFDDESNELIKFE